MNRFTVYSVGALMLVLSIGCASAISYEKMQSDVQNYKLPQETPKDNAIVYVVRPSQLGTLIRFNVFLDDHESSSEMGYTRGNQYIYFYVTPGSHVISSKAENWADMTINANAGQTIFVQQNAQMGIIMARNS